MNFIQRVYWKLYRTILNPNDYHYLKKQFELHLNYSPNMKTPKTYNEQLMWLKLYWRTPLAYDVVDKFKVRSYVKDKGLDKYLVQLYDVHDHFDAINFDELPSEFIIKNTGDSGGVKVVNNNLNVLELKKFFEQTRREEFSNYAKEWVYSKSQNKLIIEELIKTEDGHSPLDYKFFCFHGEPRFLFVGSERDIDVKFDFFDLEWNHLPVHQGHEWAKETPKKPENFSEMLDICRILSADFPAVRVDLYNENGQIYFGELTFFHFGGIVPFDPIEYDEKFGSFINLDLIPENEIIKNSSFN